MFTMLTIQVEMTEVCSFQMVKSQSIIEDLIKEVNQRILLPSRLIHLPMITT